MSGKGGDINTSEPRANGVTFQSSIYGSAIPIIYGRARMPGNLMWYGSFKSIAHTTSQEVGGKGGGGGTQTYTSYTYSACFLFGLGEGPIHGIDGIWSGKNYKPDPANLHQTVTLSKALNESHAVSGSHTVTVSHATQWKSHIDCSLVHDGGTWSTPLVNGVDFTVSSGVYYFNTQYVGSPVRISYQFNAINSKSALITVYTGSYPQAPWSYLISKYPSQAIGYQGVAYAAALDWQLGGSAAMPNINFDVVGHLPFDINNGIFDADPKEILVDLLTNPHYGLGFPSASMGDLTQYHRYCVANSLFLSPVYSAQEEASSIITQLLKLTNSGVYFSEGKLKICPFGDAVVTGHGTTFTPNLTPVYELNDDDFIVTGDEDPITIFRRPVVDAYNHVQVEFLNSSNQFNTEVAEAKDLVAIDTFGLRTLDPIKAHEITSPAVAKAIAQNILQRSQYVRNTYTFKLGWRHCLLEPTDYVTLTDMGSGLLQTPVRILSIEEDEDGLLSIEAEDAPPGVSSHAIYPHQEVGGYTADYNLPSGAINTPVILEAPWSLTANGHEIWVAVSGGDGFGGCSVWLSSDGTGYKRIGEILSPARHGFLTEPMAAGVDPDTTSTCAVDLSESSGELLSGSYADADNRATLAWVDGEFISYSTATLTGPYQYTLSGYLRRGLYATPIRAHATSSQFTRCDAAIFRYSYDPELVGKTVFLKFPAFNQFGAGGQSLADAAEYPFKIVGELPPPENFRVSVGANGSRVFTWGQGRSMPSYFAGYRLYYASGSVLNISKMLPMVDGLVSSPVRNDGLSAGQYTFAVVSVNSVGRESEPAFIEAYIADPAIPAAWTDQVEHWVGTWDDLPATWDDLGPSWENIIPMAVEGGGYICGQIDLGANRWTRPMVSATFNGGGSATFQMRTGLTADGYAVGDWRNLEFTAARYLQIKANITGSGAQLTGIRIRTVAITLDLNFNDVDTLSTSESETFHRIGVGHFSVGTNADTDAILGATVDAIQGVGAGASWELVSKTDTLSGNPAATFKVYNAALALVDAVVDVTLKIVQKVS